MRSVLCRYRARESFVCLTDSAMVCDGYQMAVCGICAYGLNGICSNMRRISELHTYIRILLALGAPTTIPHCPVKYD